jgi:uncharacterized protein YkwD
MHRLLITLAVSACAALATGPAVHAAPVAKKTRIVCKKKVVRTAGGKKKTVKRCYKKTVKRATSQPVPVNGAAAATATKPVAEPDTPAPGGIRADLRECANKERAKVGLGALKDNPILDVAAQAHSLDMKLRHYFSHDTPEGKSPFDRIDALYNGFNPLTWMGENIAMGFEDAASVCEAWMNSPGHRANILRPQFKEIGTGWIDGYAAQEFGARG